MTTIIGIKTTSGSVDAVVMGADTRRVYYDNHNNLVGNGTCTKFIHREGAPWIMAYSGWETPHYQRFYRELVGSFKRELQTTMQLDELVEGTRTHFEPVARLAMKHRRLTDQISLLLAAGRSGGPGLWSFAEDGTSRELDNGATMTYVSIGESEKWAKRIFEQLYVPAALVTFEWAVELIRFVLGFAQGKYTRGYQLAVITSRSVELGPRFTGSQDNAWSEYCAATIKKYTGRRSAKEGRRFRNYVVKKDVFSEIMMR